MTGSVPVASVVGRFQPLHREHLDYIIAAFERAEFVHIGITQFQRRSLQPIQGAEPHRDKASSNPLTYFERAELVTLALDSAGVQRARYRVGPFPIERHDDMIEYLPLHVPVFITRVDKWSDRKAEILISAGYEVEVLYDKDPKGVTGTEIRRLILAGDDAWTDMVPEGTIGYLRSLNLGQRIANDD
jgi:nicotinamide mononucleotide adenylyltransferase